jgi:rare lipoprotein A (peptidoglycan hydrolase)
LVLVKTHALVRRSRAAGIAGLAALALPSVSPADAQAPSGAKLRVAARQHILYGSKAPVNGTLTTGEAGKPVSVQIRSGRRWKTVARTHTVTGGRFRAEWRGKRLGRFSMRAVAPGVPSRRVDGKVVVYRRAAASWYGPGLYGNKLACGGTLTPGTVGVANKTLPCGTKVTLRYRGHTATVPVIDRGPYAAGRDYDLTERTKHKLHFGSTGTVWSSK